MTQLELQLTLRRLCNRADPDVPLRQLGQEIRSELLKLVPAHTPVPLARYRRVLCTADDLYYALILHMDSLDKLLTFLDTEARYAEGAIVDASLPDGPYSPHYYM